MTEIITYKQLKAMRVVDSTFYDIPVAQENTKLGENPYLKKTIESNFPCLFFGSAVLADGNIIIQDTRTGYTKATQLNRFANRTMHVVDPYEMSQCLMGLTREILKRSDQIGVFLIQGGGEDMEQYLFASGTPEFAAKGKILIKKTVTKQGLEPRSAEIIVSEGNLNGVKKILVFDDVVASGWTSTVAANEIKRQFRNKSLSFATWIMVKPENDYGSGLALYNNVYSTYVVEGNQMTRPPINSLSRLVEDIDIRRSYGKKYIKDLKGYEDLMNEIRGDK